MIQGKIVINKVDKDHIKEYIKENLKLEVYSMSSGFQIDLRLENQVLSSTQVHHWSHVRMPDGSTEVGTITTSTSRII